MSNKLKYSKELDLKFSLELNGDYKFEDGVVYSSLEVLQLRRLKATISQDRYPKWIKKIHTIKKFGDAEIGIIMPLNPN